MKICKEEGEGLKIKNDMERKRKRIREIKEKKWM